MMSEIVAAVYVNADRAGLVHRSSARGALLSVIALMSVLALLGVMCTPVALGASASAAASRSAPFIDGRVLVGLRPGVSRERISRAESAVGGHPAMVIGAGTTVLTVPAGTVRSAIARLRANPAVRYAEADYIQHGDATPNDPLFGEQWGLQNTGQTVSGTVDGQPFSTAGTPGADISAAPAWNRTTGTRGVVVAVLDSGVDYNHPDLAPNVWSNDGTVGGCPAGTHGYNFVAGSSGSCDPLDDSSTSHGTHVSGILGAGGNNAMGVAGVNWTTSIMALKWTDANDSGATSKLIQAIDWAVQAKQKHGVNVRLINDSVTYTGGSLDTSLSDAIDRAGQAGILFVTAAGNTAENNDDPKTPRYPCDNARANEICVGASDQHDNLAGFSDYGPHTVDLVAPGENIKSTIRVAAANPPTQAYGFLSGGSMAAPMVSGAAALILSTGYQSVSSLKADILDNVDALPSLAGKVRTGGRLDLCRALPGCVPPPPASVTATAGESNVALSWSASPGATGYEVLRGTSAGAEGPTPIATPTDTAYADAGLHDGTAYYYEIRATNASVRGARSSEVSATPALLLPPTSGPPTGRSPSPATPTVAAQSLSPVLPATSSPRSLAASLDEMLHAVPMRMGRLLHRGLRTQVGCSVACTVLLDFSLDPGGSHLARPGNPLGLGHRVVRLLRAGHVTVTVSLRRDLARRLGHVRSVRIHIVASGTGTGTGLRTRRALWLTVRR